ncbi:MAG: prepilin-type N-terminal cleavage/methylation domain-containing protein [Pseudomonadota bacterium]
MRRARHTRRRRGTRGFSLVEVVVALTVTAMTITLLSGAAFSMRLISERSSRAEAALDVLTVRRLIRAWASATQLRGVFGEATFMGDDAQVRMQLVRDDTTGAPSRLGVLRIEREGGISTLTAVRAPDRTVWQDLGADLAISRVYATSERLQFAFLTASADGRELVWTTRREPGSPPLAMALQIGETHRIVGVFEQEIDPGCLALNGIGPFQRRQCAVR